MLFRSIGPAVLAMGPDFMGGFAPILWIVTPIPLVLAAAAFVGWAMDWDAAVVMTDRSQNDEA